MYRTASAVLVAVALISSASCAAEGERGRIQGASDEGVQPLYDNLGSLHHEITTSVPQAQSYFDQGLRLLYAFNHAESVRAFEEAERLDPSCAMCAWGAALASGPNINDPLDAERAEAAYAAIQRALNNVSNASKRERAFIEAIALRFAAEPTEDRASLDSAYAQAMAELAANYRGDLDAQVLYADALMNLSPWYYWTEDGAPRPATEEILARLEYAMTENPEHPGACHLYIHAQEAHDPYAAVECAERLATLMPGAGHVVHMPGHIYIRVGRYSDAIEANRHAVHADESYFEGPQVNRRGIYPQGYYPHNYHFMSFAASMAGQSETAIYGARKVAEKVGPEVAREVGWLEAITPVVYWTLVTFGQWDQILSEPLPPEDLRFSLAMAHYARGVAFAAKGEGADARAALDLVTEAAANFPEGDNKTALEIAQHSLAGEIDLRGGDPNGAIAHFGIAAELEDGLTYSEPPTWYYPVRQSLGTALLGAGRAEDAERVYREDLERFPDNGWSLYGLYSSLEEQGKAEEAEEVEARFQIAWQNADVTLTASRF